MKARDVEALLTRYEVEPAYCAQELIADLRRLGARESRAVGLANLPAPRINTVVTYPSGLQLRIARVHEHSSDVTYETCERAVTTWPDVALTEIHDGAGTLIWSRE